MLLLLSVSPFYGSKEFTSQANLLLKFSKKILLYALLPRNKEDTSPPPLHGEM